MRAQRRERLALAIERRRAAIARREQAIDDYINAMEQSFTAKVAVLRRYPEYYGDFMDLEIERVMNWPQPGPNGEPDPRLIADDRAQVLMKEALEHLFARRRARREQSSGMLAGPHSLRTTREARHVSLRDLSAQSELGGDVLSALEEGRAAFASEEEIPDELLVELAIALRVNVEILPSLLLRAAVANAQARSFAEVVGESAQTDEVAKARWLRAAKRAERAAEGEDLDGD
jgi:transcriptional regulator with XRE-family HTH domain